MGKSMAGVKFFIFLIVRYDLIAIKRWRVLFIYRYNPYDINPNFSISALN